MWQAIRGNEKRTQTVVTTAAENPEMLARKRALAVRLFDVFGNDEYKSGGEIAASMRIFIDLHKSIKKHKQKLGDKNAQRSKANSAKNS